LVLPIVHAQDYEDMNNDANSIRQDQRDIRHDRREQREDIENGNFGAAAREQGEIEQRRAHQNETKEDLNNDLSNRHNRYHDDNGDND
jgi:hypothetical protein